MDQNARIEILLKDPDLAFGAAFMGLMMSRRAKTVDIGEKLARVVAAVHHGDAAGLEKLLRSGVSPNDPAFEAPLLSLAIKREQIGVLPLLLAAGADPNTRRGTPPLLQAVNQRQAGAVRMLVDAGAKLNIRRANGETELFIACHWGDEETVTLLLDRGAKPDLPGVLNISNRRSVGKVTPLMLSAKKGHEKLVRRLLQAGAKPQAKDSEGHTALHWVRQCRVKASRVKIERMLQAAGAEG